MVSYGLMIINIEKVYEEFVNFKCLKQTVLFPTGLPDDTVVREYEVVSREYITDTIWYHIQKMRNLVGNNKQFPLLFKVARLMLAPHSNASIERVFSTVNKSKGKGSDRNHLNIEGSLS